MKNTNINNVGEQLANWLGDTESNYGHEPKTYTVFLKYVVEQRIEVKAYSLEQAEEKALSLGYKEDKKIITHDEMTHEIINY